MMEAIGIAFGYAMSAAVGYSVARICEKQSARSLYRQNVHLHAERDRLIKALRKAQAGR